MTAIAAGRAKGGMFFSVFGTIWLLLWSFQQFSVQVMPDVLIVVCGLILFFFCYRIYRANKPALAADAASPARKRMQRFFRIINSIQWIAIVVIGNVLANIGLSDWIIPLALFIIGLHFLPLANLFSYRPHYVTGAVLVLLAISLPLISKQGPREPMLCLGAGLVLWASAIWAISKGRSHRIVPSI